MDKKEIQLPDWVLTRKTGYKISDDYRKAEVICGDCEGNLLSEGETERFVGRWMCECCDTCGGFVDECGCPSPLPSSPSEEVEVKLTDLPDEKVSLRVKLPDGSVDEKVYDTLRPAYNMAEWVSEIYKVEVKMTRPIYKSLEAG